MAKLICQKWEEIEVSWGARPDGYSLHPSMSALKRYIKNYLDSMPDNRPSEYSQPNGKPYEVEMDKDIVGDGERFYGRFPGSGGTDGWKFIEPTD